MTYKSLEKYGILAVMMIKKGRALDLQKIIKEVADPCQQGAEGHHKLW